MVMDKIYFDGDIEEKRIDRQVLRKEKCWKPSHFGDIRLGRTMTRLGAVVSLLFAMILLVSSCSESNEGGIDEEYNKMLVINELTATNRTGLQTAKGDPKDWIEIKNISSDTIDLEGYGIEVLPVRMDSIKTDSVSEKDTKHASWSFPSVKIGGGECLVVFAAKGKNASKKGNDLIAKLKLPKKGGVVRLLSPKGTVLSEVEYGQLEPDQSLQRQEDSTYVATYLCSPGFDNTLEGYEASCANIDLQRRGPLLIWELMSRAQNSKGNWVEIKNVSDSAVNLSSYCLSKKMGKDEGWALPDKILQPGQIVSVQFVGKKAKKRDGLQAPFKLGDAETVLLTKKGKFVDGVCAKTTIYGTSIGRANGRKGFFYYSSPSRNADNGTSGRRYIADMPQFDHKPGIYKEKKLRLRLDTQGRTVHYTLDGSEPTSSSPVYKDSIVITKSTVIRSFAEGDSVSLRSGIATATYLLDVNHDMAVINIAVNKADLYDYNKGIYADGPGYSQEWPHKGANYWKKWEKKAHVEFFDGKEGFSQDCGLKIFGGYSRSEAKKSFCLKFRGMYGCAELGYDFFDNGEVLELQDLVLRSGSQDYNRCMIRDEFFTSLMKAQSPTLLTQIYRPVALYINAEYFGLYYIREKIDKNFVSRQLNVPNDSINIVMSIYTEEGSSIPFKQLLNYVSSHDMRDSVCYNHIKQLVDLQGLVDQKLGQIYSGNSDVGNVRYVRSTDPKSDGKWHFVFYDLDATWVGNKPSADFYLSSSSSRSEQNVLINRLLPNKNFRALFLQRLSHHMHNTFSTKNATAVFDNLVKQISNEMKLNCERWPQLSYEKWEKNIASFREPFATKPQTMLNDLRKYLSITDEENKKYFGDLGY